MKVVIDMPEIDEARAAREPAERKKVMVELACVLFQKNLISFRKARELAGLGFFEFQHALAERKISRYTMEMLEEDMKYVRGE